MILLGIALMIVGFVGSIIIDYKLIFWTILVLVIGVMLLLYGAITDAAEWSTKCESLGGIPKIGRDGRLCLKPESIIEVK